MTSPFLRLGAFYFFYFAVIGGFQPYWGLYLQGQGFSPAAIGELMAIVMATRIIAPNFWGYIADHTGKRLQLVRFGAFMMLLVWLGVFWAREYWSLALVLLAYGFFQNAILAQFEAVTMAHLGARRERYSLIRLWGSLGFIVTGTGLGILFDHISVDSLPIWLLACALATWLSSLLVPDIKTPKRHEASDGLWTILKRQPVWAFFLAHFLLQFSHAPYYTFYSIHLEEHGYSRTEIGWLWGVGVLAEILLFLVMHRFMPWLGEMRLMLWSLLLAGMRWLVIGFMVDSHVAIWLAQLLHAASFATFHAAAMVLIYRHFGDGHQGQGQAIYSMLWGMGVAIGSLLTGMVWAASTSAWVFAAAALMCLLAWIVLMAAKQTPTSLLRPNHLA
ncbi:MAG: MFS transporter [Moraxellaceae bacterium]|nr:MFS transporter [Moraxellaceae bacterium]MDP1776924.1 MFS transporter [Moraxellaceae bacterium]MDZ4298053.1 MFS transporter [Moraxellaceae bacterium]MDZ4386976.1 MFS transporter [Moraxellaceae bacterium]